MQLDKKSLYLRSLALRCMKGGMRGHLGSSFSLIEIMRTIYDIAKFDAKNPKLPDRDRIILSKGHGCIAQYVCMVEKDIIPIEYLDTFCRKEGKLGGHPSPDHLSHIEAHTGALGHGLSIGLGMALAAKIKKQTHRIFVICGDGEIQEGSVWEAALCAAKHKLDNLTLIIDHNKLQSAGFVDDIQPMGNLKEKFNAFGFSCYECNGHDVERLKLELEQRYSVPNCIIAHTVKGRGISFAENNPMWHYKGQIDDKLMCEMESALGYVA